jgi:tetratricopeptide (TPR) repeat protein/polyferredoxin
MRPRDAPATRAAEEACLRRPRKYGRWRAGSLALVYVLFGLHIAHWKVAGRTLAPLELNEVMYTLELGIVTAGFLFMAAAFLSAAIFGRFFCSWGCHILALEDLCNWLLSKIRLRPKPVRSRVLWLVPPAALFYMFLWPQVSRLLGGRPLPELRIASDAEGWASFVTTDFWRNLPGPGVAILTFAICGFAIVYILGSRSFCTYGCPYGVVFSLADRIAPGRIKAKGECRQAVQCTAVCPSHVRVHEEIGRFGNVVDSACLKCLACVGACPNQALGWGLTRPSLLRSFTGTGRRRVRYDFTLAEDLLMAAVFIATVAIFRGLYQHVPFLMTLGLGAIFAYVAILCLRLVRHPQVRLNNFQLKLAGRLTGGGQAFTALGVGLAIFTGHSAYIRYHEFLGQRAFDRIAWYLDEKQTNPPAHLVARAFDHLRTVERWGLLRSPVLDQQLASLHLFTDPPTGAEPYFRRILSRDPDDYQTRHRFAGMLIRTGRVAEAREQLRMVASATDASNRKRVMHARASAHLMLGRICASLGDRSAAIAECQAALAEHPDHAGAHLALGELFGNAGEYAEAVTHLRAALVITADSALGHYNLAVMLAMMGESDEAIERYREAVRLDPNDAQSRNNLGLLLAERSDLDGAVECFRRAINLAPRYAQPYFNLAQVLERLGHGDAAVEHFQQAARLDPNYARFVPPGPR